MSDWFTITINNINDAPTLENEIADQSINEDDEFTLIINPDTFQEIDAGDYLIYTATLADDNRLPAWLNFNASNRSFSGTPLNEDVGIISVKMSATDQSLATVYNIFSITIHNTNDAPTLENEIPDQVAYEASVFDFTFDENTFKDIDLSDSLSYSAALVDGQPLPLWLSFDYSARNFIGIPTNDDIGTIQIKITATDESSESISDVFMITINNENDVPTLVNEIPDQTVDEDIAFDFTFSDDTFNTDFHLINFRQNFPLNIFLSFRLNYSCLIFCMQNTDMIDIFDALIIVSYALIFYIGGTICRINMLTKY